MIDFEKKARELRYESDGMDSVDFHKVLVAALRIYFNEGYKTGYDDRQGVVDDLMTESKLLRAARDRWKAKCEALRHADE